MAGDLILCLDSGTTAVKAAVLDRGGQVLARAERPNSALERRGIRVEQDMARSLADACAAIRECRDQAPAGIAALALTGQGDGLWPLDARLQPAGKALTWLDGRAGAVMAGRAAALDKLCALTSSMPTPASQSLQLLWLQCHDPDRFAAIAHLLRLKEWLFYGLTGKILAEAGSVLPVWGDWRSGALLPEIEAILGLRRGIGLLPPIGPVDRCIAPLSAPMAGRLGLPVGLPVVLGPGDVQSGLVGLGVGPGLDLTRASIFGTSAIHGRYYDSPGALPKQLSGAMVQRFATGSGFICFHPSFNGGTVLQRMGRLTGDLPAPDRPVPSGVLLLPFFEPGGERAPVTHAAASASVHGLSAST
ncbi:MAG: FGGY family carbohydrate kinase, partial [Paracoccus sp. (in: a-proteobacteria)]